MYATLAPTTAVSLSRQDLVSFEPILKQSMAKFLPFKAASLFFPQTVPAEMLDSHGFFRAAHLPKERKILLPLLFDGELMGMLVLKGVTLRAPKTTLAGLPPLATSCLEQLFLQKVASCDALTGLLHRQQFLALVTREISSVRHASLPMHGGPSEGLGGMPNALEPDALEPDAAAVGATSDMPAMAPWRASLGVLAIRLANIGDITQKTSHCFAEEALVQASKALAEALPETAAAARVEGHGFGVFLREATPKLCREVAVAIRQALDALSLDYAPTDSCFHLDASCGFACFPQDIDGINAQRDPAELARVMLEKAQRAATAAQRGTEGVFGFKQVLEEGGAVSRLLPMHRVIVTLGQSLGAEEGQRFLIWGKDKPRTPAGGNGLSPLYKGELLIMETSREQSLAEVMHLADPTWNVEEGDRLTLVKDPRCDTMARASAKTGAHGQSRDMLTGLMLYRDFLEHLRTERDSQDRFALSILRVTPKHDASASRLHEHAEQLVGQAASLAREVLGDHVVGGRYSLNSCMYFHPGQTDAEAMAAHQELAMQLDRLGVEAAVGVAGYPYLSYRKPDVLENCRKALEYALLLPSPHLATCDSLALTIQGDRLFSQNDLYSALEEYRLALVADACNTLARVSLGVCEARLGRLPQARAHFEDAVAQDRTDSKAYYNLGCVCHRLGETAAARKALQRCIKLDPDNLYALIRLGQLAETSGSLAHARRWFNKAAALEGGEALTRRALARLCYKQQKFEEAREHLHQALLHDPKDAHSLNLLARLYLDTGEDPELARTLASQSVALMPTHRSFLQELARAFDALGRPQEAKDCLAKASGM